MYSYSCGFTRPGLIRLRASSVCRINLSKSLNRKFGFVLLNPTIEYFLNIWIVRSALFVYVSLLE